MSSDKETKQTSSSRRDPWAPAAPALNSILKQSSQIASNPSTFAPTYGAMTREGMGDMAAAAREARAPGVFGALSDNAYADHSMGRRGLHGMAAGDHLNGNAHLLGVLDRVADRTRDRVNAAFAGAGRYGSGSHADAVTRAVGDIYQQGLMDNYETERGRQVSAQNLLYGQGGVAGGYAASGDEAAYGAGQRLFGVGQTRDQYDDAVRQAPQRALEWQSGLVFPMAQAFGSQDSNATTVEPGMSPWQAALGVAATAVGGALGGPMGAQIGSSLAGGISGGFGGGGGKKSNAVMPYSQIHNIF